MDREKHKVEIWKELEEFCRLCDPSTKYMETCDQCEKRWYVNRLAEAREEIEKLKSNDKYYIDDKGYIQEHIDVNEATKCEQIDHYCNQWQERYGNILDKYLKLSDKYFDLLEKYKNNEKTN